MQHEADTYLLKFAAIAGSLFVIVSLILILVEPGKLIFFCFAYLLSFVFTGSNFLVMRKVELDDQSKFTRIFGSSLVVRFLLVIAALIFMLKALN
ncbi:MAG: hypothetical protein JXR26_03865, partial [Balneolaceae bacterium]|nr:hypothetical protein [Balneolaceae bacterium]